MDGAKLLLELASETDGNFTFQYSPESFPGTEVDYAVDVCNAVLDVLKPTADNKAIINIPTTVENAMPHVFACQLEYVDKNLNYRDNVILCLSLIHISIQGRMPESWQRQWQRIAIRI